MTRLVNLGWETGDINEGGWVTTIGGPSGVLAVVSSTPTPRAGTYCLRAIGVGAGQGQIGDFQYKNIVLPAAKTDIWVRFAFYASGISSASVEYGLIRFSDPGGTAQWNVAYTGADGLLRAYRGQIPGSNLLATASTPFAQNGWHVIECRSQHTSLTAGISEVWVDGNRVINFSGDNVASTVAFTDQVIQIGCAYPSNPVNSPGPTYLAFDDFVVNDTNGTVNNGRPGDGRIIMLTPNGAGNQTQLTRGGTDTGANWSQTSETPPSMGQFVYSSTVGQRDLYTLSDVAVALASVNCVEELVLAQNSDAGGGNVAPTIRSGGTTYEGAAQGVVTSPNYLHNIWETDPATSAAWTLAGLNALEAGVTVR